MRLSSWNINDGLLINDNTTRTTMGVSGTFICKTCDNHFPGSAGGMISGQEIRCEDCDSIQFIRYPKSPPSRRHFFDKNSWTRKGATQEDIEADFEAIMKEVLNDKDAFEAELAARGCEKCSGQMRLGLAPKCPACGTRNAELDRTVPVTCFD
jgi:hypothetical protein